MLHYHCGTGWAERKFASSNLGVDAYLYCPGPSLKEINPDLVKGKGRLVFSINTSYPYIKPDIWLGMDKIECYDRNILSEPFIKVFREPYWDMEFNGTPLRYIYNTLWATVKEPEKGETMFNKRAHSSHFVWHKSTLMVAIHMMVWMGAKTIYLGGCDMGGKHDYYKGNILTKDQRNYNKRLYNSQVNHLKQLVEIAKQQGITFKSITPNSPINDFMEYVHYEKAIKESEEKVAVPQEGWDIKHVLDVHKPTVVCLYKGKPDYSNFDTSYVYRLKESVDKYLPNHKFVCLTDTDLPNIDTISIDHPEFGSSISPGWCKIELYKHFTKGKFLFIDLSVVIKKDLKPLAELSGFRMVRDFANPEYYSSCVMIWEGDHSYIFNKYMERPKEWEKEYRPKSKQGWKSGNSQLFVQEAARNLKAIPDKLVRSYKISTKEEIEEATIVKYHGSPKPHEVNWEIHRPQNRHKSVILHVTNWAIWGGIQSMILSLSKEYVEYEHKVVVLQGKNVEQECLDYFKNNNIKVEVLGKAITEKDVDKYNPKTIFLHNTTSDNIVKPEQWIRKYNSIAVNHGRLPVNLPVDLYWFVSSWAKGNNKPSTRYIVSPPSCYIKDYIDVDRPYRKELVIGRIQSVTNIHRGKYSNKFFELMRQLPYKTFIVGHKDGDAPVKPGMMQEYLKEIDIMVIWGDTVEASPLVIAEANLSGIPVIQRNLQDGAAEKILQSGGGILVNTEEEFIQAIHRLAENEKERNQIADKGKTWNILNSSTEVIRLKLKDYL